MCHNSRSSPGQLKIKINAPQDQNVNGCRLYLDGCAFLLNTKLLPNETVASREMVNSGSQSNSVKPIKKGGHSLKSLTHSVDILREPQN